MSADCFVTEPNENHNIPLPDDSVAEDAKEAADSDDNEESACHVENIAVNSMSDKRFDVEIANDVDENALDNQIIVDSIAEDAKEAAVDGTSSCAYGKDTEFFLGLDFGDDSISRRPGCLVLGRNAPMQYHKWKPNEDGGGSIYNIIVFIY